MLGTLDSSLLTHLLQVGLLAFGGAIVCVRILMSVPWLARSVVRRETGRSMSIPIYFRLGGLAIAVGFCLAFWFDVRLVLDTRLSILLLGGVLALLIGLIDDFFPLHWLIQLAGQSLLGILLVGGSMTIHQVHFGYGWVLDFSAPPFSFLVPLLTIGWVILVMNATNWIDGSDGVMGAVMGVALVVLVCLSFRPEVNQPAIALLGTMLLGGIVGFLVFNWYPARIEAGSSGTYFLGFLLAALAVYAGTKVATALLVLTVPILDALAVIGARLSAGRSPFQPDQQHLHHLLRLLGWSPWAVAILYGGVTSLMGILALSTRSWEKLWVLLVAGSIFLGLLLWLRWMVKRTYAPTRV